MLRGGGRVVQEAQRDPARGEFLLGLVDVARGQRGVARDQIGVPALADVEHLARQQAPLDPPFVDIVEAGRVPRRAEHELGRLGELLFAAEQLDPAEDVTGIAVQLARHRVQQRPGVGGLAIGGDARPGERDVSRAQSLGGAQRRLVLAAIQEQVHPRLLIARRQQRAEQVEGGVLGFPGHGIVAPGIAHQTLRIGPVAAREHHPRQRELALGRQWRFVFEPGPYRGVVAMVVPQRRLEAPAQEGLRRPAGVAGDEGAVALDRRPVVVAAQDDPFGKFPRHRIR